MLNRRRWLTGASGLLPAGLFAYGQRRQDEAEPAGKIPAAIAALKSRRDEAKPITVAERSDRLERARRLMAQNGLSAVCIAGGTSLSYFTGVRWGNSERLFTLVLPKSGAPFYVSPAFEEDRAREQISQGPDADSCRVMTWQEDENPYQLLHRGLTDAGISTGTIGIEEKVPFVFADGIGKASPGVKIASATPVTAGCRMIKSPAELSLMRLAAQVTLSAYEATWKSLEPGMTQNQVSGLISAAYHRLGFPGEASIQVGEFSALPHGSRKPQIIRDGTVLLIDDGCLVEGYSSDISRTFVLGKASDKVKKVFEIVHSTNGGVEGGAARTTGRRSGYGGP